MLKQQILKALEAIIDPDFQKNIVELNFIKNLMVTEGHVSFEIELTTPACPIKDQFEAQARQIVQSLPGVHSVQIKMTANTQRTIKQDNQQSLISGVRNIIAVASGKGGVGKSTVTANLAMALSLSGARVGVLDADIYGPSMVMMFNIQESPTGDDKNNLYPVITQGGIKVVSMAMFANENKASIMRGPMVSQMVRHFVDRVHWGELDYLLIDFPPGTGDIQLSLTQNCPLSGAVVVTTPQEVSLIDVRKGLQMFDTVNIPVLGVVENMSYFICDHCDTKHFIFKQGGGQKIANKLGLPFLGEVPLEPGVAEAGDDGLPIVLRDPNSVSAFSFMEIAGKAVSQLAIQGQSEEHMIGKFDWEANDIPALDMVQKIEPISTNSPVFATKIGKSGNHLVLYWSDGQVNQYEYRALRLACPCAHCIDEWTQEKILDPAQVALDIHPLRIFNVGRYAMGIIWSDGHDTGIFTWKQLRNMPIL
jgi:ATP-binding protein involved in chromosome partitioning